MVAISRPVAMIQQSRSGPLLQANLSLLTLPTPSGYVPCPGRLMVDLLLLQAIRTSICGHGKHSRAYKSRPYNGRLVVGARFISPRQRSVGCRGAIYKPVATVPDER